MPSRCHDEVVMCVGDLSAPAAGTRPCSNWIVHQHLRRWGMDSPTVRARRAGASYRPPSLVTAWSIRHCRSVITSRLL